MIPLRAERRPAGFAAITWAACILCAVVMLRISTLPPDRAAAIMHALAVVPARLLRVPVDVEQLATLLTSQVLHAGWLHVAGNVLFLAIFGPTVEHRLGWRGFAALYLASGLIANACFVLTHPGSQAALVGASGAIAGVLGAHLVLEPRARITTLVPALVVFEVASLPAVFIVALWFAAQIASTVAPATTATNGAQVAWIAHIAGFVAGAVLAAPVVLVAAVRKPRRSRRERRKTKPGYRRAA